MELFRDTNIDFLGKKWYFLTVTMILFVVGMVSLAIHHGPDMGIDFTGGTQMDVKFDRAVPADQIRHGLESAHLADASLQPVGGKNSDEVLISLPLSDLSETQLDKGKAQVTAVLYQISGNGEAPSASKQDINNIGPDSLTNWLVQKDPNGYLGLGADEATTRYRVMANEFLKVRRDVNNAGLLRSFDVFGTAPGSPQLEQAVAQDFFLGPFAVRGTSIIGPQVGKQLRGQAIRAVLYSLVAMLIYIAFRFELIYGLAAVVAVFHDVLITLGMFSLARLPITLTVIAAFLTLVGYSMNDTIVVFDRVRENLPIMRREKLSVVVNRSINQTLSRTVLTSGLTFLSVLSLLTLGGQALRGFSFAMTFGILVGTYSSIAVAAPMMVAYIEWRNQRQRPNSKATSGNRKTEKTERLVRSNG